MRLGAVYKRRPHSGEVERLSIADIFWITKERSFQVWTYKLIVEKKLIFFDIHSVSSWI